MEPTHIQTPGVQNHVESKKEQWANKALAAAIIILGLGVLVSFSPSSVGTSGAVGTTEQAQENYDRLAFELCERGLKPLATAKINDKRTGVLKEDVDLNDLFEKERMDCMEVAVQWSFK